MNSTVYVVFRPEDFTVLAVFSTEEKAEQYQSQCYGGGQDLIISDHQVDEEEENPNE